MLFVSVVINIDYGPDELHALVLLVKILNGCAAVPQTEKTDQYKSTCRSAWSVAANV